MLGSQVVGLTTFPRALSGSGFFPRSLTLSSKDGSPPRFPNLSKSSRSACLIFASFARCAHNQRSWSLKAGGGRELVCTELKQRPPERRGSVFVAVAARAASSRIFATR